MPAEIVQKRFPPDVIHQYVPFDTPRFVSSFLDHWQPGLALFIESDIWPNLILSSAERRIPMAIINARMSQRSFPRWRRFAGTIGTLLDCFDLCLAQSDLDGERYATLGSRNVVVTGNLKLDVPAPPADANKLDMLMSMTRGRPVVVNLWATWCVPCVREFPLLRQAAASHRQDRLAVVGVLTNDRAAAARAFVRRHRATWPVGIDEGASVAGAWGAVGLPHTYFIRPDGTLASNQLGELDQASLDRQLAGILG